MMTYIHINAHNPISPLQVFRIDYMSKTDVELKLVVRNLYILSDIYFF